MALLPFSKGDGNLLRFLVLIGAFPAVLIMAKLRGYLDWSWWLILAPVYVPALLIVSGLLAPVETHEAPVAEPEPEKECQLR